MRLDAEVLGEVVVQATKRATAITGVIGGAPGKAVRRDTAYDASARRAPAQSGPDRAHGSARVTHPVSA